MREVEEGGEEEDADGNPIVPERRYTQTEAIRARTQAVDILRGERTEAIADTIFYRMENGAFRLQAGGLTAYVETVSKEHGDGVALVDLTTSILWKIKSVSFTCSNGQVTCPELSVFSGARQAQLRQGFNDGLVPGMLVMAAEFAARMNALALAGPANSTIIPSVPATASSVWRHWCHQVRGTGAEVAAMTAFGSMLLVRPDPAQFRTDADESDVQWVGKVLPGLSRTGQEILALLKSRQGFNAFGMHSARSEFLLGTLNPMVLYFVENNAVVRHPEAQLHYERNSADGILLALRKIAVCTTLYVDQGAAVAGGNQSTYMIGAGWADLGNGSFGPAVLQTQVRHLESRYQEAFNSKYSRALCVSVGLTRPHVASAHGSAFLTKLRSTTAGGECPERYPPYIWTTMAGDSLPYLPEVPSPDLASSGPVEPHLAGSDQLVHGHVVSVPGGTLTRPLYVTVPGIGAEAVANLPYGVFSCNGNTIGPRTAGVAAMEVGSFQARAFDAAVRGLPRFGTLDEYSRTMGTSPYATMIRDKPMDTLIDLPLLRSAHGAQCLMTVCVPQTIRAKVARSLPVPVSGLSNVLSSIFR